MAFSQHIDMEIMSSTLTTTTLEATLPASTLKGNDIIHNISRDRLMDLIHSISENQETPQPFYLLDLGTVERLMHSWKHSLPTTKPFYAVKCNPNPALLAALASLGANFDCASQAEIETILGLGVSPDRILYANPCKAVSHIKYAASVGVNLTTFDSKGEIEKIKQWHPKCALLLRIKIANDHTSWRPLGTKFGALPDEILPLLSEAHLSGLKVEGVSFHVGSKASNSAIYRDAIAAARDVFEAASQLGMPSMQVLNIGGGFKDNSLFSEIGKTVNEAIKDMAAAATAPLSVMAEPGRFFAETVFTLVTNVFGKRVRGDRREYWIENGIYGAFNPTAYDRSFMAFKPLLLSDHRSKEDEDSCGMLWPSTIFGPTCDAMDVVATDCKLPELQVNDLVVFYNMGAYTASAGTKFNGFDTLSTPTHLAYTRLS
ncbi:ornithine decarboxylase-like [Camellia sinensis]|uniref:ornithine decarboxylase n=1 Tax=Camellia sinensis var. sinensis TaxID=542762 RepID=A0A4S4ENN9_CAMSN|nr:ornithine decarboxylase-like [Camellia sinensis]THG17835.1 hypothetical protein TEA_011375 [Camellia sinensis var. sinensis]